MKLTRRGELVFSALLLMAGLAIAWGFWEVMGHLWWVGDGYCWGSMLECMEGGL